LVSAMLSACRSFLLQQIAQDIVMNVEMTVLKFILL